MYGVGMSGTFNVPPGTEERVRALAPWAQYGPDYTRPIADGLGDLDAATRSGNLEYAERILSQMETRAARSAQEKEDRPWREAYHSRHGRWPNADELADAKTPGGRAALIAAGTAESFLPR